MAHVLVAEEIAESGLDRLRSAGHEVRVAVGLDPDGLLSAVADAEALIIRSATQVTAEVLQAAPNLVVVGRAGVGLDNVDTTAATARGVMVANAPQSNVVSAAEQTMALILAVARNTAQANRALVAGRWERSQHTGVELSAKTLGIVGLGRIGALVAERAAAFGMRLVGHDPFVSADRAAALGVELVDLSELAARADFVTLHVAKTPHTVGLIGEEFLSKVKPGIRIVNVARGGIVDEAALLAGLQSGRVGGAGLDVFDSEPCTDSPLFALPNVVATPHLGASTVEAQDRAGETIAEQVLLALAGEFVPFAVNVDAGEVSDIMRPYVPMAEELGCIFGALFERGRLPHEVTVGFAGEIGGYDNRLALLAAAKGLFSVSLDTPVSYVNALDEGAAAGTRVEAAVIASAGSYRNKLSIAGGGRSITATLIGLREEARIIELDGHQINFPPRHNLIIVGNDDRPGVVGTVGSVLGEAGLNIDDMAVGRGVGAGSAVMVIATDSPVSTEVAERLANSNGVVKLDVIEVESPSAG